MGNTKYNILFCDDETVFLNSYEKMIENSNELKNRTGEIELSKTLRVNAEYDSVEKIVKRYHDDGEKIDIAILDVNFEKIKELDDHIPEGYIYSNLGVAIANYLSKEMKNIEIIFVTANSGEIKKLQELLHSNISYVEKQLTRNLEVSLEEKILEIMEKRVSKKTFSGIKQYYFDLDYEGNYTYWFSNHSVKNGNESLKVQVKLTDKPSKILNALIISSCCEKDNNNVRKNPLGVNTVTLKETFISLLETGQETENVLLYKEYPDLLLEIFKKITEKESPECNFDKKMAKRFEYGYDKKCKTSCEKFLSTFQVCPMCLSYQNEPDNKKLDINKYISQLKSDIKEQISENLKNVKNISDFKYTDGSELYTDCRCRADDFVSVQNCKHPFCSHSIIFSDKVATGKGDTKYKLLAKPSKELVSKILLER